MLLPPVDSRLLTRELFYTAITRAVDKVRVVGSEEAVREAIERASNERAASSSGCATASQRYVTRWMRPLSWSA